MMLAGRKTIPLSEIADIFIRHDLGTAETVLYLLKEGKLSASVTYLPGFEITIPAMKWRRFILSDVLGENGEFTIPASIFYSTYCNTLETIKEAIENRDTSIIDKQILEQLDWKVTLNDKFDDWESLDKAHDELCAEAAEENAKNHRIGVYLTQEQYTSALKQIPTDDTIKITEQPDNSRKSGAPESAYWGIIFERLLIQILDKHHPEENLPSILGYPNWKALADTLVQWVENNSEKLKEKKVPASDTVQRRLKNLGKRPD